MFPVTMMSLQCNEFLELKTRHKGSLSCEQAQEKREVGRGREQMGGGGEEEEGSPNPHPNRLSATSLSASSFSDLPAEVRPLQSAPFDRLQ